MIDRALSDGPQVVTRNGTPAVVVVSVDEWRSKSDRSGSLAEYFARSPLWNSGVQVARAADRARELDL